MTVIGLLYVFFFTNKKNIQPKFRGVNEPIDMVKLTEGEGRSVE
jgi:hypothetical protein